MMKDSYGLRVGWLALAVMVLGGNPVEAVEWVQVLGEDHLAFQGESADPVLNPDAADDIRYGSPAGVPESPQAIWTGVSDGAALDGEALRAPASPHKQTSDPSLQESIAVYPLRFATAGSYRCYLRVRNDGTPGDGSTDSLWVSSHWNEELPSGQLNTGSSGGYEWREPGVFEVTSVEVGERLEFRVGVRESSAHLDAVVFSVQDGLDDATLDGLVPAGPLPPPPPTSGVACASTVAELHAAIADARPGDTILMCNGVWNHAVIVFDTDGLPGQPITLRAEVDGQVRLEGNSQLFIAGDYLVVHGLHFTNGTSPGGDVIQFRGNSSDLANHSRLTECAMTGYNPADPADNYKWVSVYGFHNRVDHCHFSGMNHAGVTLTVWLGDEAPANHTRIDANYFGDRAKGDGNGFETIRIGTSGVSEQSSLAVVESNYFYHCDGEIEIISSKTVGNTFRRNLFVENDGQLTLRHGRACTVEGNYFLGHGRSGSSGVRVVGPDHVIINNYFDGLAGTGFRAALAIMNGVPNSPLNRYLQAENVLVAFNTFVNCEETFVIGTESSAGDTTLPPRDCTLANNVVQSLHGPLVHILNEPENMLYEGNILFGAPTGIAATPGIRIVDPELALAGDGLLRPGAGSPVIQSAAGNYPAVVTDLDGDVRVPGAQDVGADEFTVSPPLRLPFGPDEIGPRWMRPNTPEIVKITTDAPDEIEILFTDRTGMAPQYTLERTDDLLNDPWSVVGTFIPADPTSTVFRIPDSVSGVPRTYWRIVNQ